MFKMILDKYTMTVRRFGQIDETKKLSLMKRKHNLLPAILFKKRIEKNLFEIADKLNKGSKVDRYLLREVDKSYSWVKIVTAEALYAALFNLLVIKKSNDSHGVTEVRESVNLEYYITLAKTITRVQVKDDADLVKLKKEVERLKAKYLERFNEKADEKIKINKQVPFLEYAMSVFSLSEKDYQPEMMMFEFIELVKDAERKAKELEKIERKYAKH